MCALDKDKPIFCTTKRWPLTYMKNGVVDDRECQMMAIRWNTIYFNINKEMLPQGPDALPTFCRRTRKRMPNRVIIFHMLLHGMVYSLI